MNNLFENFLKVIAALLIMFAVFSVSKYAYVQYHMHQLGLKSLEQRINVVGSICGNDAVAEYEVFSDSIIITIKYYGYFYSESTIHRYNKDYLALYRYTAEIDNIRYCYYYIMPESVFEQNDFLKSYHMIVDGDNTKIISYSGKDFKLITKNIEYINWFKTINSFKYLEGYRSDNVQSYKVKILING